MAQMRRTPDRCGIGGSSEVSMAATDPIVAAQLADTHAWTAVFLADGRVVSLAWLRGYPGAVDGRWREVRRGRAA